MRLVGHLDALVEAAARRLAQSTSRRGFLAVVGGALGGGLGLPLLPVDRSALVGTAHAATFAKTAQNDDPTQCNYWRYCAVDGYLCSCCGGTVSTCPPGTQASPTAWIGSCVNPDDGETYLVAYRDCCGQETCGRCACRGTEGEMPLYRPQLNGDILWCFGVDNMTFNCATSALLGKAGG